MRVKKIINNQFGQSSGGVKLRRKRPPQPRRLFYWLVWGTAFCLTATISAALGATVALFTPLAMRSNPDLRYSLWQQGFRYSLSRPVNILLMGVDWVPDAPTHSEISFRGDTDTMLLIRLNPTDKSVNVLSIPRDTQVEVQGLGVTKINQANRQGGATLAASVVSKSLNNVTIDRYIRVNNNALQELVELLGGVEVNVPYPMQYKDNTQKLTINLKPGWQNLNGSQAEQFVRFRNDGQGDIGRVQRQQMLLQALRQRLTSPGVLPKLPQIFTVMQQYIDTNLSLEETMALGSFVLDLQADNFRLVMLPGRPSQPFEFKASYWLIEMGARDRIMRDYFQVALPEKSEARSTQPSQSLRIAIQNASGEPKVAAKLAAYLNSKGLETVYLLPDANSSITQTQVIAQQGDINGAKRLERLLGFGRVEASSTGDIGSDFTIRVGRDWVLPSPIRN